MAEDRDGGAETAGEAVREGSPWVGQTGGGQSGRGVFAEAGGQGPRAPPSPHFPVALPAPPGN